MKSSCFLPNKSNVKNVCVFVSGWMSACASANVCRGGRNIHRYIEANGLFLKSICTNRLETC